MECHYHPEREGTDTCAICGKSICKECGLEIAGKIYCKECLESIVGIELDSRAKQQAQEPVKKEPARLNKQPVDETVSQPQQAEEITPAPQQETPHEIRQIHEDSPYNVRNTTPSYPESSQLHESEVQPPVEEITRQAPEPQITQTDDYIYPDHSYEPEPTSARQELEDKYERYLDDLYFDEEEVPLDEQLAKDEEQYGSLTRKPYTPREEPAEPQQEPPQQQILKESKKPVREETPEEMEARLRAEILAEKNGEKKIKDRTLEEEAPESNIHNINYKDEKEPMGAVDILLTIILIIIILVVIYYIIYIFMLSTFYPTFIDAIYGLSNPQNVINNILAPK